MTSHRCGSGTRRTMISKNKTSTSTILLSLMTMTVIGINDQVASWPMVESPRSWPTTSSTSSPSPSSSSTSPTFNSASEELDSDSSRKVLGSSVVTSVSVVMNNSDGKNNSSTRPAVESTVAIGDSAFSTGSVSTTPTPAAFAVPKIKLSSFGDNGGMDHAQLKSNAIPSPGNFLNPDKYEFYTFDESGDLVKKLMSWEEIQGLIAASDTDGLLGEAVVPIYYNENANAHANGNPNAYIAVADKLHGSHLTANEIQTSDIQDVRKVVESVQNVLKSELAVMASSQSKIIPAAAAIAATAKPSSLHSNSPNWSSLFLPNFLENLDEDAFVDLQQHHHHLSSDDALAITSPILQSAQHFNKTANETVENTSSSTTTTTSSQATDGSSSSVFQTRTTPAVSAPSTMNADGNNSEKHSFITQSNNVTFRTSPTPSSLPQKFTPFKNTASKPLNFKYSSSATSEKVWSLQNSIASDEKPTKNFIMHSSSMSTSSSSPSPSTPMSTSSPPSSFSTYSHSPTLPLKSHWSTKTSPSGIPAAAITPATVATSKTTMVASSNGNSISSPSGTSIGTTNRNSFPATFGQSGFFSLNDQQQMAKIKPAVDSLVHDSSSKTTTTAKHHYTSHFGQRNNATVTNSNSVPITDREKTNASHYQLSSSSQLKNNTDKVTATSSLPYTRYTGNSNVSNGASDLATRTTTDQYQHNHGLANSAENSSSSSISASSTPAQSSLSYRQSSTSTTNSNPPSWKINGISGGGVVSSTPPVTSTTAKLNSFTPYRTTSTIAAANANVMAETAAIRMTPSTNTVAHHESTSHWPMKIRGGENQPTTTAEPLVTWISTNNFDDRVENKIYNGQILDSDKLVTEQYVSVTAPGSATVLTTNEQLVSFSKDTDRKNSSSDRVSSSSSSPFSTSSNFAESVTKKTTIWGTTFGNDNSSKTTLNVDGKKPSTQTLAMATSATTTALSHQSPSSSYHTWLSAATTNQPSPSFGQQQMIPNRINSVYNGGGSGSSVESKTAMTPNSNNHQLHHNHHLHHHHHHHHHHHEQSQQQNPIPNRNSGVTFSSYYHRDRPSASSSSGASSSSTVPETNFMKYTKTPSSLAPVNATTSNEMVMQRIPTLDPPNKIASPTNGGQTLETNENDVPGASTNAATNTISSTMLHHSSTESAKNLTQIAVMVNKSNSTQVAMTKNTYNKNVFESKHRPATKPNHFYDSTVSNTPTTHKKYNTNDNEDKTQPTVKPINVEFLNDCITSFISNSMVSSGGGGGGNNDREHGTSQSLSYNGNVGTAAANASHDNHYHHYNLHHQDQDHIDRNHDENDNFADKNGDYRQSSTAANYVASALFSRDQTKYNTSSGAGFASAAYGATQAATGDTFQQKVTLPGASTAAAVATAEKQKENSHIYYYKLPPINSQPLKANANTITSAGYSSAASTASTGNSYSSTMATMTTAAAPAAAATATWTTSRPTSQAVDKTYQKITTVNRPSSSPAVTSSTNSQNSLHTEARISSSSNSIDKASTISIQDTPITRNSAADSSIAAELETREASATTFHQFVDTKSSQGEIQGTSASTRHDDEASTSGDNFSSIGDNLKTTMASSNSGSTRRTEPIATPQVVTVSLNFSSTSDVTIASPTTPVSVGDLSDLRKEDNDDKVGISITNDDDDDENENEDDDDDDDNAGYSSNSSEDDDSNENSNGDDHQTSVKEQAVENDSSQQVNRENDHRHKAEQETMANKNQRVANVTAAQFWPVRRKTTPDEPLSRDRTRTNTANRNFTTHQERIEMKTTQPTSSWSSPHKNLSFSGTTSRSGDVNSASNIVAGASTTTMPTTFGNINFSSSIASLGSTLSAENDGGFVRVKLENRTTPSFLYDATTTSATINKQKEDKIKPTLGKNQPPSKQNGVSAGSTMTAPVTNPSSSLPPLATNSGNVFRSPGPTPTLARLPQPFTSGFSSNTGSPIAGATPTTTSATWTTNGNGNVASAAVELHPAPHENMGLEASIAYLGDDVKTYIDLCNELSFKIWTTQTGKSLTTSRSIVLSPFALLSTLAMIFLGARGSSSGIMNDFLRLDDMVTFNPHQVFRNITESAVNSKNTGAANVAFVRQVFSDKTKGNVLEFYKERLQQYYDTYVEEINFNAVGDLVRRRTNLLVKRQTQGRIQDYLRGSTITMKPPLATFTANIFQTDCSTASTEGRDGEMYFVVRPSTRQRRLVPIPAVVYRGGFLAGYEPGLDATAVTLSPESVISTILVLPGQQGQVAPGDGLARLEQRLLESSYRRGAWSRLLRSLLFRHGLEVQIPRFSHKSILNLTMGLQRMGMGEIFTPDKADLRGINGLLNELHLSDCVQANTFSTCGEESVGARHHIETFPSFAQRPGAGRDVDDDSDSDQEASSTTTTTSPPPLNLRPRQARLPDNPRLRFDRPFLYIVRHNPTGMILYIGRFNPRLLP